MKTATDSETCPLSGDSQTHAAARVLIKRAARRAGHANATVWSTEHAAQWARENPELIAAALFDAWERSARTWTRGNNSGDSAILAECEAQAERIDDSTEIVAALFGVKLDWPGLYPCATDRHGSNRFMASVAEIIAALTA